MKKIFISYSWRDKEIVNQIDKDLQTVGITLIRDIRDIEFKSSIKNFMKRIRFADYVLMIISNSFLKSHNCMYEVLEFIKDENYKDKILPIILPETNISSPEERLKYVNYWQDRVDKFEKDLSKPKLSAIGSLVEDLVIYKNINNSIAEFLSIISDMHYVPLEELKKINYRAILEKVGFNDSALLEELLRIKNMEDKELQDIALTDFIYKNSNFAPAYLFRAFFEKERGNYKKSEYFSSKAIELNPGYSKVYVNANVDYYNFPDYIKRFESIKSEDKSDEFEDFNKLSYYAKLKATFDFEFNQAAEFQHSFLPRKTDLSEFVGVKCDYIFHPLYKISADFIDFSLLEDNINCFFIADISGRGLAASLISSILKVFYSIYSRDVLSPQLLFELLNMDLAHYLKSGEYFSSFYGIYFPEEKKFVYSNANHPTPLLLRVKTGEIVPLHTKGFFVGVFENAIFEENAVSLEKGDRILFYTDGVVEAKNLKSERFGEERLRGIYRAGGKYDISDLIRNIEETVVDFSGMNIDDDITIGILEIE